MSDSQSSSGLDAPVTVLGILRRLGPGLIIAGSIVGSGELIGTTTTGAKAGFDLLWLIIVGCIIKVWVQVELGRYTMVAGVSTMRAMNETPGPSFSLGYDAQGSVRRVSWLSAYWLIMFLVSLGQLGGIVGGVGQSLAIAWPITAQGKEFNRAVDLKTKETLKLHQIRAKLNDAALDEDRREALAASVTECEAKIAEVKSLIEGTKERPGLGVGYRDEKYWAALVTVVTSILLVVGRYGFVEVTSTVLVAGFTFLSVLTVVLLQLQPEYAITLSEIARGLSLQVPPDRPNEPSSLGVALATFGIIGVGANELIQYPYWCLEKGYARFTGKNDGSEAWAARTRGWLRVLHWDAWCSMFIYTFATIAFYLLGAAILGRLHLVPGGTEMIRTLAVMYEPVFGVWTSVVFLIGAFAVLYSTFFVANAGHARVCADAVRVFTEPTLSEEKERGWVKFFSGLFPFICLAIFVIYPEPKMLVLASGAMQAVMLPMLAFTSIYFRYKRIDPRLAPGRFWDVCLWISALGMLIVGLYIPYLRGIDLAKEYRKWMDPPKATVVDGEGAEKKS